MTSAVTSGHFPLVHLYLAVLQCVSFAQRMPDCCWPSQVHMFLSSFEERQVLAALFNFFNNHMSLSQLKIIHSRPEMDTFLIPCILFAMSHFRVTMTLWKWGCHPEQNLFIPHWFKASFMTFPWILQHMIERDLLKFRPNYSSIPRNLLRIFHE